MNKEQEKLMLQMAKRLGQIEDKLLNLEKPDGKKLGKFLGTDGPGVEMETELVEGIELELDAPNQQKAEMVVQVLREMLASFCTKFDIKRLKVKYKK